MKVIDYVVRDSAGLVERGLVPEAAQVTTLVAGAGEEISLNLSQVDLRSFQRNGETLVIELADGRVIVIENYFNAAGAPNRLFISADGYLNEVGFADGAEGNLFAQYGPTEQWGKWSPSDDLIFLGRTEVAGAVASEDQVSMLGAGLLGASGLWGAGAVAAAAGATAVLGGSGEATVVPAALYVNGAGSSTVIGGDGANLTLTVSGGGEPGETVSITVGDQTAETVIGADGTFETVFTGGTFPQDGTHEAVVVVTDGTGGQTTLGGPGFVIDTIAPDIAITSGAVSTGDSFNADAFAAGVSLTGTGEAGASVAATIGGVTRRSVVGADGTWSLTWQAGVLPEGEYSEGISLVSRDAAGNSRSLTDQILVDTVSSVSIAASTVEGDGVINAAEHSGGVTVTGTAQAGSSVEVAFGTGVRVVTADQTGAWSAQFAAAEIATGEYDATITATATDPLGNTAQASGTVRVDTGVNPFALTGTTGGSDGVVNAAEALGGIVMTGTAEPGSSVSVSFAGVTRPASVAHDGTWSVAFTAAEIPPGAYTQTLLATATDAAGNTATLSREVAVDTVANSLTIARPIEGDDVINGTEAADGVVLSGSSVPGAVVQVTLGSVTHSAVADGAGTWQAFFAASGIVPGTHVATITATSTDAAGNANSITETVRIDTLVDTLSVAAASVETDGVISDAERADGVRVSGTVEPGSVVEVTLGAQTVQASVDGQGRWTADFAAAALADGEYTADVVVKATDAAGNMAVITDGVEVDTFVNAPAFDAASTGAAIEGDGTVNAIEALDGINLGGQVEPGASVVVNFHGVDVPAAVGADGTWSVLIPASAIAPGSYDATVTVTATDAVGNTDSISQIVAVDTDAPEGPVVAAFTRDTGGLRSVSTEGDNAGFDIARVEEGGAVSEVAGSDTYIAPFGETLHAFSSNVPDGSDLVITSTDAAGNSASTYLALDDRSAVPGTVDRSRPALGGFQIEAVDLQFAEAATLSLTDAQIVGLSQTSDTLTVHGGADDTVQIAGITRTGSTSIGGQSYDAYTSGDATLIIDSDIRLEEPPLI